MRSEPATADAATVETKTGSFEPSRAAGLDRLDDFLPRAGRAYAKSRNYDFGPDNRGNVSTLSPYTRHRLMTEAEIVARVLERHAPSSAEKFIQEVCWRTYWKGWLEHRPGLWPAYLAARDVEMDRLESHPHRAAAYNEAVEGRTGMACFNTWNRELLTTGYLHNHARMWFASIWIFTLRLPWVLGADHFCRHLIDGDPASNTLSWRWVAGLHTKGKTYLARPANIATYTDGRFPDTRGLAIAAPALAETFDGIVRTPLSPRQNAPDGPTVLLLHEEDLNPESLPLANATVAAIAVLPPVETPAERAPPVLAFKRSALDDAARRAGRHFAAPVHSLDGGAREIATAIETVADEIGTVSVVTAEAPVGPARSRLDLIVRDHLADRLRICRIRRDWDDAFWPHATGGFFKLKKQIPSILAELGLGK